MSSVALVIFDLDNTLIAGDSDHAWNQFLVQQGLVDADQVTRANDIFYQQYEAGALDINAYLSFALAYLAGKRRADLVPLQQQFMADVIIPMVLPLALAQVQQHRAAGDTLMIITATNRFIAEPIAEYFAISHLIACEPELRDGVYTGKPTGIPSYQEGKVTRLMAWLGEHDQSLQDAWFYSDSHNDLPLLEHVDKPVAVNPDPILTQRASAEGWPVLDFRRADCAR